MHSHLGPNIPKYKHRGKIYFHDKEDVVKFVHSSPNQLNACGSFFFISQTSQIDINRDMLEPIILNNYTCSGTNTK